MTTELLTMLHGVSISKLTNLILMDVDHSNGK
jgi:hypothetical protein